MAAGIAGNAPSTLRAAGDPAMFAECCAMMIVQKWGVEDMEMGVFQEKEVKSGGKKNFGQVAERSTWWEGKGAQL